MDFIMEWNAICRICLQEGDLHAIFGEEDKPSRMSEKIMLCSSIIVSKFELICMVY